MRPMRFVGQEYGSAERQERTGGLVAERWCDHPEYDCTHYRSNTDGIAEVEMKWRRPGRGSVGRVCNGWLRAWFRRELLRTPAVIRVFHLRKDTAQCCDTSSQAIAFVDPSPHSTTGC